MSALSLKKDRPVLAKSFLKFQLAPNVVAMFPARAVQEAVVLPTRRVMAMPNMPAALLGLTNRRGRVFWVANLVRLLGLPVPDHHSQQYSLIVVQGQSTPLALQVEAIDGMVSFPPEAIHPPPNNVSSIILPYLTGCITHNDETIFILDVEALLQSPVLQAP
ncbi:purine-binding chemotaxis protein CheW [Leptolyngbyaceae cyanobacterium CCMR0082]|uniref:Purine-binding chemotaxis protein CheW n=1 Tax=Adonisia turfae CCMR0082 TaxID=2304604 RepID=A0A6M0S1J6_9CYAN|nr:purine-binding chemotaxis protein CheW [Adonisia turfae CCMR0082]